MNKIEPLSQLFSGLRQPVVGSDKQTVVFANPAALAAFGDNLVGSPLNAFLPEALTEETTPGLVCAAKLQGHDAIITTGKLNSIHLYYIDLPHQEASSLKITRHMMGNLRNSAMGVKMSADRCFTLMDQGKEPLEKHVSIMYHYYHCLARSLTQIDNADLIERGNLPFSPCAIDLIELCSELCLSVESLTAGLGINISFTSPDAQVIAVVDPTKIQELLINLFSNSIKSCSHGDSISLNLKTHDSKIIFSLDDTGKGIPQGQLAGAFALPNDDYDFSDTNSGIGLGLYIAYGITSLHKGVILLESRENEGTHLRIMLPADEPPNPKFMAPPLPYHHSGATAALTGLADVLPATGFGWKFEN